MKCIVHLSSNFFQQFGVSRRQVDNSNRDRYDSTYNNYFGGGYETFHLSLYSRST